MLDDAENPGSAHECYKLYSPLANPGNVDDDEALEIARQRRVAAHQAAVAIAECACTRSDRCEHLVALAVE